MKEMKDTVSKETLIRELYKTNQKLRRSLNEKYLLLQYVQDLRAMVTSLKGHIKIKNQAAVSGTDHPCSIKPAMPVPKPEAEISLDIESIWK